MTNARELANLVGGTLTNLTSGTDNVALGDEALEAVTSGANNVGVGKDAGTAITTGDFNTAIGANSLDANTTADYNTAIGYNALTANTTGTGNVAVGVALGANTTANDNTAMGNGALGSNITGASNTAIGRNALVSNTASGNTAVGYQSLDANTSGNANTAVGKDTLSTNISGANNTAVGNDALFANTASNNTAVGTSAMLNNVGGDAAVAVGKSTLTSNTTGRFNTGCGYEALYSNTTGGTNTAVGQFSLGANTTGYDNVGVGNSAGGGITTGYSNTFIGKTSGSTITTGASNTILGRFDGNQNSLDIRTSSNNIVLSDGAGNPRFYYVGSGNYWNLGTTNGNVAGNNVTGFNFYDTGFLGISRDGGTVFTLNRKQDGTLAEFRSQAATEGSISISGSTTSFNGFSGLHESSGIPTDTAVGTVVSTIDELDVYPATQTDSKTGEQVTHPKAGQTRADHAKVKVSDTAGDSCVYGVVANFNAQGKVNVTSVGIGSVRVTGACAKGDLLESNGDGTAKVQSDDIIRSKTIGKVTIGNSTTGVKLVSCVMYCG